MFHGRISLNSVLLLLLVNFVSGFRLELMYISHCKYQVKTNSSPWFSAACAAATVYRNQFFQLHQQNKSSKSNVKIMQASNHCKRVLEVSKLEYATKTKESITSQKLGTSDFSKLLIVFSTEVNLLYLFYSMERRCRLLHLINQHYLLNFFLGTLILMTLVSLYLFSLLELI